MIEVLKFSATWCGPCKMLSKTLEGVEGITNVDIDTQMDLAKEYNVRSVPAMIFKIEGEEVHREVGLISLKKYEDIINELATDVRWKNK